VQGISICADWATQGDHKGRSYHGRPDASWATTRTGRPHANRTTTGCEPGDHKGRPYHGRPPDASRTTGCRLRCFCCLIRW